MLAQTNDVECPINCWKRRLLIPAPPFLRNLCLHREQEKYICWHRDQSPPNWYDDFSAEDFFGSRGSRVFIAEEAAESKEMNAPRPPQGFLSSVVVARCLVSNQISKHNMRSYKNVLMPAGGIEPPQCQWYSVRRKVLLGQKKRKKKSKYKHLCTLQIQVIANETEHKAQ